MKPKSAAGTRPRIPPDRRLRRGGYRNTRVDADTGARWKDVVLFAEGSSPISTVLGSRVDAWRLLVTLMSIRLTLCGSNVCLGRNLITVFFTVNTPAKIFFDPAPARHRSGGCSDTSPPASKVGPTAAGIAVDKKKLLLFSCIVRATARKRSVAGYCTRTQGRRAGQHRRRRRRAKNFFAKVRFAALHRPKCANFSCHRPTSTTTSETRTRTSGDAPAVGQDDFSYRPTADGEAAVDPLHAHRHPQTRSIATVSRKQKRPLSRPFWMTPAEVKNQ